MSRRMGPVLGILLLLAGVFCWSRAMLGAGLAAGNTGYRIRLEPGTALTDSQLEPLDEERNPYVLARESAVVAQAPLFSRRREMTSFSFTGDPGLLFSGTVLAAGAWPGEGGNGCVVDTHSARVLWGEEASAIGQALHIGDRELTVVGLMDTARPAVVFHRENRTEFSPTLAGYLPSDPLFPRQELDTFLTRASLTASSVSDQSRWSALLRGMALLPTWILCVIIAYHCLRLLTPHSRLFRWILLAGLGFVAGKLLQFPNLLFPELLPTRWSDFSFWGEHLRAARESLASQVLLPGSLPDLLFAQGVIAPTLAWSTASLICYLIAARSLRAVFQALPEA